MPTPSPCRFRGKKRIGCKTARTRALACALRPVTRPDGDARGRATSSRSRRPGARRPTVIGRSRRIAMRATYGAATALMLLLGTGIGQAREYPWCAQYSMRGGPTNCGFDTFAQCRATVSGVGGFCNTNPRYRRVELITDVQPPVLPEPLFVSCYRMADQIVPPGRGRRAGVVRHADYCLRNGGRL